MSLDTIARLDALVPNPDCMYKALSDLLPQCVIPGELMEKTWISVQLSICELEVAGIGYPQACLHRQSLQQCTKQLESKGTWWTTFSGNYRHIATICDAYRPQYEAQHAAAVYKNITKILFDQQYGFAETLARMKAEQCKMDTRLNEMHRAHEAAASTADEISALQGQISKLQQLILEMPTHVNGVLTDVAHVQQSVSSLQMEIDRAGSVFVGLVEGMSILDTMVQASVGNFSVVSQDLAYIHESSQSLVTVNFELMASLANTSAFLRDINLRQDEALVRLDNAVNNTTHQLAGATAKLETVLDKFKGYMGILLMISRALQSVLHVAALILGGGVLWIWLRHSTPEPTDLIFY